MKIKFFSEIQYHEGLGDMGEESVDDGIVDEDMDDDMDESDAGTDMRQSVSSSASMPVSVSMSHSMAAESKVAAEPQAVEPVKYLSKKDIIKKKLLEQQQQQMQMQQQHQQMRLNKLKMAQYEQQNKQKKQRFNSVSIDTSTHDEDELQHSNNEDYECFDEPTDESDDLDALSYNKRFMGLTGKSAKAGLTDTESTDSASSAEMHKQTMITPTISQNLVNKMVPSNSLVNMSRELLQKALLNERHQINIKQLTQGNGTDLLSQLSKLAQSHAQPKTTIISAANKVVNYNQGGASIEAKIDAQKLLKKSRATRPATVNQLLTNPQITSLKQVSVNANAPHQPVITFLGSNVAAGASGGDGSSAAPTVVLKQ